MNMSLDNYINTLKSKLEENYFSTSFIRLANIYHITNRHDECIKICKIGLSIYPDYLTAKLILLKALIRLEYLGEAESLFREIENKIQQLEIADVLRAKIEAIKRESVQERIYYPESEFSAVKFLNYANEFTKLINPDSKLNLSDYLDTRKGILFDKNSFENFEKEFNRISIGGKSEKSELSKKRNNDEDQPSELFGNIKFISETLADIYAKQGNFKEAFNMYNFLIRAGSPNKERIERKLDDLERDLIMY
ncbi:MAG: hypothetical protein OZ913_08880 [Ignavibacteriaceae bacterium]|jgi:hypothetical protein|nr:MAG: hypothetical protein EDM69_09190 [Chlorobiota bacterium]MCE7953836.1 hypothetical protein [Chlorobi bacterium CHB7]MDL1887770.1 hypothetical protein [Ignavibacteria bacterium CHB1]MEB2330392.1 hypothetical protein [Ignavibacteriaceae bacterium]RIK48316.1 MAG: hypothetical protein DCC60_08165 [Ignavibacteriota bacterium]